LLLQAGAGFASGALHIGTADQALTIERFERALPALAIGAGAWLSASAAAAADAVADFYSGKSIQLVIG